MSVFDDPIQKAIYEALVAAGGPMKKAPSSPTHGARH